MVSGCEIRLMSGVKKRRPAAAAAVQYSAALGRPVEKIEEGYRFLMQVSKWSVLQPGMRAAKVSAKQKVAETSSHQEK